MNKYGGYDRMTVLKCVFIHSISTTEALHAKTTFASIHVLVAWACNGNRIPRSNLQHQQHEVSCMNFM